MLARADALPSAVIPDASKLFQSWLIATQAQGAPLNALIVELLFKWLVRIEEGMRPVMVQDIRDAEQHDLDFPHVRDVRDEIRTTCFALSPTMAPTTASVPFSEAAYAKRLGQVRSAIGHGDNLEVRLVDVARCHPTASSAL